VHITLVLQINNAYLYSHSCYVFLDAATLTEVFITLTEVFPTMTEVFPTLTEDFITFTEVFPTLTEVFPCFFLSCKTNAMV